MLSSKVDSLRPTAQARSMSPLPPFIITLARCALPLAALAIGLLSLTTVRESAIGQYGLIQALPPLYFVSVGIVAISFIIAWRSPQPRFPELILGLVSLVVLLQGAPGIIESEPRFATAWLHVGYTDFVAQTGRVLPGIDARFNWPSFFTGMAFLDRAGGLPSAIILLRWWPVFLNLLYLPPLYMLAKLVLRDEKKAMLATWLFPFANWVGQDYYSPQSVAYLLYLALFCVVLGPYGARRKALIPRLRANAMTPRLSGKAMIPRLRRKPAGNGLPADKPGIASRCSTCGRFASACRECGARYCTRCQPMHHEHQEKLPDDWHPQEPAHAITLLLVMLALCAAMDTGHQLTPVFAVATMAVLVFLGRTRLLAWAGVMFLLAVGWICYGAATFWRGHFTALFGGLTTVGGNYAGDLRLHGNAAHSQIADVRLLFVGVVYALAVIGFFAGRKMRADRRAAAVMMLTPLVTIAGQSYGQEAGLRAFLFSLPGVLCLVVIALTSASPSLRLIPIGVLTAALIPAFMIARWGNELFERVLPGEISAMTALYGMAPPGSSIMALTSPITWQFMDVGRYQYPSSHIERFTAGGVPSPARLVPGLAGQLRNNPHGGYLIITHSQIEYARSAFAPPGWGTDVEQQLTHSHLFRLIYSNSTSKIYQVVDAHESGQPQFPR